MTAALLPAPPRWMGDGSCFGRDPDLWFPKSDATEEARRQAETAKAVCRGCPVLAVCREYAHADPSLSGVWGGTTEQERAAMRRRRPGRPPRPIEPGGKQCTRCGRHRGLADYNRQDGTRDGLRTQCRDCQSVHDSARRARRKTEKGAAA